MKFSLFLSLFFLVFIGGFLRFYNLFNDPPGLYIDEISIGLNAYDILHTNKDQYNHILPLQFKSLGDYKMPVYIYLVVGSIKIFGKNDFAIRFPSAFAGTLTVLVLFLLIKKLLERDKNTKPSASHLALVGALIFAILPWHLHFSRGGFETCVALFFYLLFVLLGLEYWETKKRLYLFISAFLLCVCIPITRIAYLSR